ncbi:jasmonate ZIM-domain protein 5 [Artemisia annua]|uniref:Protein TIFY n=1 Tax=Artemisia annua TaxID=35608 RepID=A0A2U1MIE7_ARTAN|nr:jasmonate ZIM-domain protein 5 [Artemisia annua]
MLRSPSVEYDFFRLKDESSTPKKLSDRRDIQGVISKINPELLKTAIASASASASANSGFLTSKSSLSPKPQLQTLPVYNQDCGNVNMAKSGPPLTIFYNGNVSVFDVSSDQAEQIMKIAQSGSTSDLPLSRKKSLRRFLEKRKERYLLVLRK